MRYAALKNFIVIPRFIAALFVLPTDCNVQPGKASAVVIPSPITRDRNLLTRKPIKIVWLDFTMSVAATMISVRQQTANLVSNR